MKSHILGRHGGMLQRPMSDKMVEYASEDAEVMRKLFEYIKAMKPRKKPRKWNGGMPSPGHEHESGPVEK
jgi:hypothetical protein